MGVGTLIHHGVGSDLRSPPPGYLYSRSGFYRPEREHLLYENRRWGPSPQEKILAWLRDHVHHGLPRAYYRAVLGHDIHLTTWAELYGRLYHNDGGWWENLGRLSEGKVTIAFRDYEAACLVTDTTTYGDFKWHEVGLSATAESNAHTGLLSSSGIARVAGTQTNPSVNTYQTTGLITADTNETWQEHGIFNTAGSVTMLDRSIISPVVNVVSGDAFQPTYILTKNAEA
jgi:hypothetical protein